MQVKQVVSRRYCGIFFLFSTQIEMNLERQNSFCCSAFFFVI